jgi:membrane peptidoglycan carboxypeptidase
MSPTQVAILNSILQKAVSHGSGARAQLPDRPVAGKTGTTENYADAWFVGYTPQLVVAIWVGYPESPKPMLTEFRGEPVTGGSFPALIWKSFAERALRGTKPQSFPEPLLPHTVPKTVVRRGDRVLLDNGVCRSTVEVVYFSGSGPTRKANCSENEVSVPDVRGLPLAEAEARLDAQPLTSKLVYAPARPLQRPGVVVDQDPLRGYRSSYATLTLVVSKPTHGVIPQVVGTRLGKALARLRKLKLDPRITWTEGEPGTVLKQTPVAGLAAAPGLKVQLVVARGGARAAAGG